MLISTSKLLVHLQNKFELVEKEENFFFEKTKILLCKNSRKKNNICIAYLTWKKKRLTLPRGFNFIC